MKDFYFYGSIIIVFLLDRITKLVALSQLQTPLEVIPGFFHLTLTKNTGAAFSILSGNNSLLIFLSLGVVAVIIYSYTKLAKTTFNQIGHGLILGGALGNLLDRFIYQGIIDFLDFQVFPVFNIADSAITLGVLCIAFFALQNSSKSSKVLR